MVPPRSEYPPSEYQTVDILSAVRASGGRVSWNGSGPGCSAACDRLGRRPVRAHRRHAVCAGERSHSVPSLSLEPEFRRSHGSLYKALARGRHRRGLRFGRLLVEHRPHGLAVGVRRRRLDVGSLRRRVQPGTRVLLLGVEALRRPADRRRLVLPVDLPAQLGARQLDGAARRAPHPADQADTTTATVDQVRRLVDAARRRRRRAAVRVRRRLRPDRPRPRPRRRALRGAVPHPRRPRLLRRPAATTQPSSRAPADARHDTARRFRCAQPATWPEPASHGDRRRHPLRHRHRQRLARTASPTAVPWPLGQLSTSRRSCAARVIRVEVEHLPKPTARAKKTLWLWWSGPGQPDLDRCWRAYLRRFDIEHTFRFAKNTLGWTSPSLCTPEQADRWTALVVAALTQLRLARGLVQDLRLPWERPLDTDQAHPRTRPARVSPTSRTPRHTSQPTETLTSRPRTPQRHPSPGHDHATQPSRKPPEPLLQGLTAIPFS